MERLRNLARAEEINLGFQIAYLLILYLFARDLRVEGGGLVVDLALLALVLVPSVIWVVFFYLQDRHEPEPTHHVVLAVVAGMAAGALVVAPLQNRVFRIRDWMYYSWTDLALGSVIIIGGITSVVLYGVIRYGFMRSDEFDEPVDGMAYGSFVGSGLALVLSLSYLADRPAFTVFATGFVASTNVLVYASVGALIGHLASAPRFGERSRRMAPVLAVVAGGGLLGVYHIAAEFVFIQGRAGVFWLSFVLSLLFAAGVLTWAYLRMRHLLRHGEVAHRPLHAEYVSSALFMALLLLGAVTFDRAAAGTRFVNADYGISFRYPQWLQPSTFVGEVLPDANSRMIFSGRAVGEGEIRISVQVEQGERTTPLGYLSHVEPTVVRVDSARVSGRAATRIRYAFLESDRFGETPFPKLFWGYSDIVRAGNRAFVFRYEATPPSFEGAETDYRRLLDSVSWTDSEAQAGG